MPVEKLQQMSIIIRFDIFTRDIRVYDLGTIVLKVLYLLFQGHNVICRNHLSKLKYPVHTYIS